MFTIQLGHIKINKLASREFATVREWLFHAFRNHDETAFLFLNDIPVRLRYKQDISASFDNLLAMCRMVQKESSGQTLVTINAHIVEGVWGIFWEEESLIIQQKWTARASIYQDYAAALNMQRELQLSKASFLSEWKTLLHQLIAVLEKSGGEVTDGIERRKKELLITTENKIRTYGLRYTR